MATITSSTSSEINLANYQAAPGTLITALLINTIIDAINELNQSVEQLQPSLPATGPPPVIYDVYSSADIHMTIDVTTGSATILGQNLNPSVVVKLDSFPLTITSQQASGVGENLDSLTVSGLPQSGASGQTAGYYVTTYARNGLGLLTVITQFGTANRVVLLQGEENE